MKGNARKARVFEWDELKLRVAEACAKGDRNVKEILAEFKITEAMFYRWKNRPEFQAKIDEITQDIDITLKKNRLKIIKQEIKRVMTRLELNEDHPSSRDLVALMRLAGDEIGDLQEHKDINVHGEGVVFYIPENNRDKKEGGNKDADHSNL